MFISRNFVSRNIRNFVTFLPRNFVSCLTKQKNNVAETEQKIGNYRHPFLHNEMVAPQVSMGGHSMHISGKVVTAVYTTICTLYYTMYFTICILTLLSSGNVTFSFREIKFTFALISYFAYFTLPKLGRVRRSFLLRSETNRVFTEVIFWNSAEYGILCGSDFTSAYYFAFVYLYLNDPHDNNLCL
jgi:hypothetical protein